MKIFQVIFFSNFNISYKIPMENIENVNIFYGKVNFKSQIINFNFYFLYISNAKIKWMCYRSRLHFLRFWCLFLKHLMRISDGFKLDNWREKLIPYRKRFLEDIIYIHKMLQKRSSKTRFFYFTIFWKLMKSQKFLIFISYTIPMENFFFAFFAFLLPFFEVFGENKWYLQIRYLKRETYALQKDVIGRHYLFSPKASKNLKSP